MALPRRLVLLLTPLTLLALFFLYPFLKTLDAAFTGTDAWRWLTTPYVRDRATIALQQATASVLVTLALALPLAGLYHRRQVPLGRLHLALHAAPFVLPVFVIVYGIQSVLGPSGWVTEATGVNVLAWLGPFGAVVLAHAYYNYGFAARLLHATLRRRPDRLEEAAQVLGASPTRAFARITLPLLLPTLASVALLVFVFAFTSFGVVLFLGAGKVATLETVLYRNLGGAFPRYDRAAVLGLLQLTLNVLLLTAYLALRRREGRLERAPEPPPRPAKPHHVLLSWGFVALGLLPVLSVLAGGFRIQNTWTLEAWRALLDADHPAHLAGFNLVHAVDRSLFYAAWTTVLSLLLTALLAYGLRGARGLPRRAVELVTTLPLATSSLLVGLGFVLAFGAGSTWDLRGSRLLIIAAHTLIAFPFTARILLPALDLHDRRLDEAASLLGASPLELVRRIHWPLLRAPLLAAGGIAAAISLGDFGASLLLMRPDNMALSIWIQAHDLPFNPLMKAQAVALSGLLMVLAALAYLLVERFRGPGAWDA